MNKLFNYFERFKKHKKRVSGMLEKMVKKHVESKIKGENQVAKLLMTKMSLEELAKKHVEDKLDK